MDENITLAKADIRRQLEEVRARMDYYPLDEDYDERELHIDAGREEILCYLLGEEP